MFPISLFSWWYSAGWRDQASLIAGRLSRVSDTFSISLLLGSLFSPFRQISAGTVDGGGFDVKFRAWLDKLISRCIGAMIRLVLIFAGVLLLLFESIFGLIRLVMWPLLPLLPIIGLILVSLGWVPWQI